jgi:squalene synthase HpnC
MTQLTSSKIEMPIGKGSRDENFPVGSFLVSKHLRPHIATFYALARATDDIADNNFLSSVEKLARLDCFEKGLTGEILDDPALEKAYAVIRSVEQTGVSVQHSVDLIQAFKQDAVKLRYESWHDLMDYCAISASPVGRFLLDLHGEDPTKYSGSDALCNSLQVLNHLQDLKDDYRELDRVYLPGDWMAEENVKFEDLERGAATPALRRVIDRCLDGCEELLEIARPLPRQLSSRRLAMETAVIINLANRLTINLRRADPIAQRVALTKRDFTSCGIRGFIAGLLV